MRSIFLSIVLILAATPLLAQERSDTASSPGTTREFHRSDRPIGFQLGYVGPGRQVNLGVRANAILLNRIGLEFSTTVLTTSFRARYYLLPGSLSPYAGIGTGMSFLEGGIWTGSWKEVHAGFERAFDNGFVVGLELLGFFDRRGGVPQSYAFAPALGYRF
jgi:opacity protein-like surface antigen